MFGRCVRLLLAVGLVLAGISLVVPQTPVAASTRLGALTVSGSQTGGKTIHIKVRISDPAPAGGINISLAASDPAVNMPSAVSIPAGATEQLIAITTNPVGANIAVSLTASLDGVTRSRVVLIKAPLLTSLGLQTVIRHGGQGKVILRLSGEAPAGGVIVSVTTNPSGYLAVGPTVVIPAGAHKVSLKVDANLFGSSDERMADLPVTVTASLGDNTFTKGTIIRDFGDEPRPTPTNTPTLTETATPTETATATELPTSTATAIDTATATATATMVINPFIVITFTPTANTSYCNVNVAISGLIPSTDYTVNMFSTNPDGKYPSPKGSSLIPMDGSGSASFTPFTYKKGWGMMATIDTYSSPVFLVGC